MEAGFMSNTRISRRKWLRGFSLASLGTGVALQARASTSPPLEVASRNDLGDQTYNICDFGAKGDGSTLDTSALQAAIDACNRDRGGTVMVPAGTFVIGTIEMKSNVTLRIAAGGTLLGSADGKQYRAVDAIPLSGDSTLADGHVALIFAVDAHNFSIEGPGTIDGQGIQFHSPQRGVPPPSGRGGSQRPYHLLFYRCTNLRVQDLTLVNCAFHSVRVIQSRYGKFDGLHIHNRVNSNNDGFHFISCQNMHVLNCDVESQDDACALFGSCKLITVANCTFSTRWSVFRFGGGEAENITVSNCIIYEAYGCPIKLHCGPGSRFENITFSNLIMNKVTGPIYIGLGPRHAPTAQSETPQTAATEAGTAGTVRNISFSNIQVSVVVPEPLTDFPFSSGYRPAEMKSCISLNGVGAFVEHVTFENFHATFPGGGTAQEAAVRDVPKIVGEYFETGVLPAHALYARNVHGLTLNNVRFEVTAADFRPSVIFDSVEDAAVTSLSLRGSKDAESLLRLIDVRDVLLSGCRTIGPASVFLQVEGARSEKITVEGGDISKASTPVAFRAGAPRQSVRMTDVGTLS
jgi:polygalacturonase